MTAVDVSDLAAARGGRLVFERVTFSVKPGEALALRGPNGSGKTTLLRVIAGLFAPCAGRVEGAEERTAYAGHADGIKAALSVAENLTFWASVFGGKRRVGEAMEAFALTDLADRRASDLSAGQKRRLGLARLLVTGRPVWALDEPTVSLDAASVALFAAAVQAHLESGGIAIMATHIALGLPAAREFDLSAYTPKPGAALSQSEAAFL